MGNDVDLKCGDLFVTRLSYARAHSLNSFSGGGAPARGGGVGRLPGGWGRDGVARLQTLVRKRRREKTEVRRKKIGRFDM